MKDILANIPGIDSAAEIPAEDRTDLWIVLINWAIIVVSALMIWNTHR